MVRLIPSWGVRAFINMFLMCVLELVRINHISACFLHFCYTIDRNDRAQVLHYTGMYAFISGFWLWEILAS